MDDEDRRLLASVQEGIPLTRAPFQEIATRLGTTGTEVISRLHGMLRDGTIRRFGARIDHRKLGITANAMVCWKIPEDSVEAAGRIIAGHPGVTHCYERQTVPGIWEDNLFCVIHGRSAADVETVIREIEEMAGITGHVILYSEKKFKHAPVSIVLEENP